MAEFICLNYDQHALKKLNRVRIHQQVIFLSDVMDASGRAIDQTYLERRYHNKKGSKLIFPKEDPSASHFRLWNVAIPQIRAMGGRLHIGANLREGHKIWQWRYYIDSLQLFHLRRGGGADLYEPALGEGARTRVNRYTCTTEGTDQEPRGGPCTIRATEEGIVKVLSFTNNPPV